MTTHAGLSPRLQVRQGQSRTPGRRSPAGAEGPAGRHTLHGHTSAHAPASLPGTAAAFVLLGASQFPERACSHGPAAQATAGKEARLQPAHRPGRKTGLQELLGRAVPAAQTQLTAPANPV